MWSLLMTYLSALKLQHIDIMVIGFLLKSSRAYRPAQQESTEIKTWTRIRNPRSRSIASLRDLSKYAPRALRYESRLDLLRIRYSRGAERHDCDPEFTPREVPNLIVCSQSRVFQSDTLLLTNYENTLVLRGFSRQCINLSLEIR